MRGRTSVVAAAATTGLLVGAGTGVLQWSPYWPGLSRLALYRGAAFGGIIGLALGAILAWLLSRRRAAAAPPRVVQCFLVALAILPVALWTTATMPHSTLRKALASGRPRGETRPNLILITVDALRADHVGPYGGRGLTPAIDAFAKEATVYQAAYAASPWTIASLGALFALRPPSEIGAMAPPGEDDRWYWRSAYLSSQVTVLPERLQGAGYVTAAEVTNPFLAETRGFARGFEFWHHEPMPEGMAPDMTRAQQVTEATEAWLTRNRREPFFLWAHYLDPHAPYDAPTTPREVRKRFPVWRPGEREVWEARQHSGDAKKIAEYEQTCRVMYAEEVKYADQWVGKLLQDIRAAGLWDQSLIVFTADHGEELFDHGGIDHGHSMHRELLNVPLIVKWPRGVSADRRVAQTVALPSVGATFLESAGLTVPADGWVPALPRRNGEGQAVYSEAPLYGYEQMALTTDRWRVIYHPQARRREKQFEVYDAQQDPEELHNLAQTGAAGDLRLRLQQMAKRSDLAAQRMAESGKGDRPVLTEEARRQLKSLGYTR